MNKELLTLLQKQLLPYQARLGLAWKLWLQMPTKEVPAGIHSNGLQKGHCIVLDTAYLTDMENYISLLVHVLCRARLAEIIDPFFATQCVISVSKSGNLEQKIDFLIFALYHMEIWGYDERHRYFPELSGRDYQWFLRQIRWENVLPIRPQVQAIPSWKGLFSATIQQAEAVRAGIRTENLDSLFEIWRGDWKSQFEKLLRFYTNIPKVSYDREKDIKMIGETVQGVIHLMNLGNLKVELSEQEVEGVKIFTWMI